jgi:hypothetical protein
MKKTVAIFKFGRILVRHTIPHALYAAYVIFCGTASFTVSLNVFYISGADFNFPILLLCFDKKK